MTRIVIFGATGYAGGAIAHEAVRRGHQITAASRRGVPVPGLVAAVSVFPTSTR